MVLGWQEPEIRSEEINWWGWNEMTTKKTQRGHLVVGLLGSLSYKTINTTLQSKKKNEDALQYVDFHRINHAHSKQTIFVLRLNERLTKTSFEHQFFIANDKICIHQKR